MKITLIAAIAALLLFSSVLASAPREAAAPAQLDHAALLVADLEKSAAFYQQVVGLQRMPSPFPESEIRWFAAGGNVQLHLIQGDSGAKSRPLSVHLAFRVASLDPFMAHLDHMQVKYRNYREDKPTPLARPDGARQIYFQDPDGYWIEVNDAKY